MNFDCKSINLKKGDLVVVCGESIFSKSLKWMQQTKNENISWASHVGIMISDREVLEALEYGVIVRNISEYFEDNDDKCIIFRKNDISDNERDIIADEACRYENYPYGYWKIPIHSMDMLIGKIIGPTYFFRKIFLFDNIPICSEIIAKSYFNAIDYVFGVVPKRAQPDDILDHLMKRKEQWDIIAVNHNFPDKVIKEAYGI